MRTVLVLMNPCTMISAALWRAVKVRCTKPFQTAHFSAYSGTSRGKLVESVMCDKCAGTQ